MKKIFYISSVLLVLLASMQGCKKEFLDTNPSNAVSPNVIFADAPSALVALNGVYRWQYSFFTNHGNFGQKAFDMVSDLMGEDMTVHSAGYGWFNTDYRYTAQLTAVDASRSERMWYFYYRVIDNANGILDNIDKATGDQNIKDNVKGQALGLRAYAYLNLINFFQQTYKGSESQPGVPLYTTRTTVGKARGTVQEVYTQIVKDLTEAETLLTGKTRAHISNIDVRVVQGLRARTALLMEDWSTAATYANKVRTGKTLMSVAQYGQGFSKMSDGNPEWLWGSEIITDQATIYASFYSHIDITNSGYAALGTQKKITKALYDKIPTGDVRKTLFRAPGTGSGANVDYNQNKIRVPVAASWAADYLYMRVAEFYLIEAEALARQGQDAQARTILDALGKARYPSYTAGTLAGTALLDEILLQRKIELWGEGFGLFDVKRLKKGLNRPTGTGNYGGTSSLDPFTYTLPAGDPKFLMRIPQQEIDANGEIGPNDQNPQ